MKDLQYSQKIVVVWISSIFCALVMGWFLNLRMPFYMGDQDPSYRYLAGFVDLATLHRTHFLDHPGLPLQILGATLVRATYSFAGVGGSLLEDVLTRPELYLAVVAWTLLGLVALSIHLLGFTALRVHGSLTGALLLQIGCIFVSRFMIYRLVGVTATAMLLGLTFLLISLIIIYIHEPHLEKERFGWPLIFGILMGSMVMTKFTVLPLIVIPAIILSPWKSKIFYLAPMFLIALFLMLGFVGEPDKFWNFVWRVATRSEMYGGGNVGWDIGKSMGNVLRVFRSDPLFVILLITLIGVFTKSVYSGSSHRWSGLTKNMMMVSILAICIAAVGQWLIVVKQFRQYYMLPACLMVVLGVYLYWIKWYTFDITKKMAIKVGLGFLVLLLIFQAPQVYSWASWRRDYRKSCQKIEKYIQNNYPGKPIAVMRRSAITKFYALKDFKKFYSAPWAADRVIKKIYPHEVVIFFRKGQILTELLAESALQRPMLAIVNNNTDLKSLKSLIRLFRAKYHSVYILESYPGVEEQR